MVQICNQEVVSSNLDRAPAILRLFVFHPPSLFKKNRGKHHERFFSKHLLFCTHSFRHWFHSAAEMLLLNNLGINHICLLNSALSIRWNCGIQNRLKCLQNIKFYRPNWRVPITFSSVTYITSQCVQPLYTNARISFWHAALRAGRITYFSNKRPGTLQLCASATSVPFGSFHMSRLLTHTTDMAPRSSALVLPAEV
jgi:hypothetical protein